MYLCYIDESGVDELVGTDYFVLVGVVIYKDQWKTRDQEFKSLKRRYALEDTELHTAWLTRHYPEQNGIANFTTLPYESRRKQMERAWQKRFMNSRREEAATIANLRTRYRSTRAYHHLTYEERQSFLKDVATALGQWEHTAVLAVSIDKQKALSVSSQPTNIFETCFLRLVTFFERYLSQRSASAGRKLHGIMIQDQDQSAKRLTSVAHGLHAIGLDGGLEHIVETPLFVDSSLTSMIQLADLSSYALRRFLEKQEQQLWASIESNVARFDDGSLALQHFVELASSANMHLTKSFTKPKG